MAKTEIEECLEGLLERYDFILRGFVSKVPGARVVDCELQFDAEAFADSDEDCWEMSLLVASRKEAPSND